MIGWKTLLEMKALKISTWMTSLISIKRL